MRRLLPRVALAALITGSMSLPSMAYADLQDGDDQNDEQSDTSHESEGDSISAGAARITYTSSGGTGESGESLTSATSWTPPACYYAPVYTPTEMEAYQEDFLSDFHTPPWPPEDVQAVRDSVEERFGPDGEFPNYNKAKEDEGLFWMVVRNEDYPFEERYACDYRIFWVDFGDPPPEDPGVVDTDGLAELAWEHTRVPETEGSLNPDAEQTVNLPTWVWLDEAAFEPVTVRAELPDYGIWAETTATPTTLALAPGTEDAEVHPEGGCQVNADGSIGEPYTEGRADEVPPCGLTYLRATPDAESYELEATLTWEVTWTDYQGDSGTLPDGVFTTTVDLTVDEVQTIVR
jgi:enoyl reductase